MFKKVLSSQVLSTDMASLVLRVIFGGLMLWLHGYGKLMEWDEMKIEFANPFGMPTSMAAALTIFAEFFCCIFIVIGLFTRIACVPIIICMLVAAFNIHLHDPLENKEASLIYCAAFTAIFLLGSGKYSVDGMLFKK